MPGPNFSKHGCDYTLSLNFAIKKLNIFVPGPGVKRFISPRGRRRHSPLLLPPVPSAPEMTSSSEEELEPDDVATPEDPPAYATVFGYTRTDLISRIDEIPPPNYYSLFVNSSKL